MTTTSIPTGASAAFKSTSLLPRRISALALIVLLYTAANPFKPITWLTGPVSLSGTFLLDYLVAGIILFCACYFQWAIASLRSAVIVSIPTGGSTTQVRNGRVERVNGGTAELMVWRTEEYWHFALGEAVVLLIAEFGGSETMRRLLVSAVVLGLWVIGWSATPASLKRWAWEHIKVYLFFLILDQVRNVGGGALGGYTGTQRRRRARW